MTGSKKCLIVISALLFTTLFSDSAFAQTEDELKLKIDEKNELIKKIEEEIRQYSIEVNNTSNQAKTLQNTIKTLDLTKNKLTKDISLTENKIQKTNLTIKQIDNEIESTQETIDTNKKAIINAIRSINIIENTDLVTLLLFKRNVGEIWGEVDNITKVQEEIQAKSKALLDLKSKMEGEQKALGREKNNLVGLKQDLSGKKSVVEYTAKEKSQTLAQTKNKEQVFKNLIKTKEEQKEQFEKEIYEFESQLNILIDKGSYPAPKNGVLSWPLEDVFITQKFGRTVGAEKLYASGSHNGADFRAQIGSKVLSALSGIVVGLGNTDLYPGCYSFGKWVMVKHDNGLSTIYGHLSHISATRGQNIETGGLIGYSGNTGYSTGPHLHIGLYATQGVRIEQFTKSRGCKQAVIPLADIKAYLDPLEYFPRI